MMPLLLLPINMQQVYMQPPQKTPLKTRWQLLPIQPLEKNTDRSRVRFSSMRTLPRWHWPMPLKKPVQRFIAQFQNPLKQNGSIRRWGKSVLMNAETRSVLVF
jgi:hypothetical protein